MSSSSSSSKASEPEHEQQQQQQRTVHRVALSDLGETRTLATASLGELELVQRRREGGDRLVVAALLRRPDDNVRHLPGG